MAIGPDGRIIRRNVRRFTPVSTDHPSENTGFFTGLFAVIIVSVLVAAIFAFIGWAGDFFISWKWWNARNFLLAGIVIDLLLFPAYVSGALEGLIASHYGRYRWYSFVYGFLVIAVMVSIDQVSKGNFNPWTYLWAVGYGIYSLWFAGKMKG